MREGEFWYRYRGWLMLPPLVLALVTRSFDFENDLVACAIGCPLYAAGLGLRLWAQQHLHYRLEAETGLTRTGPYAWVRNPVYVGNVLIGAGLTALCEAIVVIPLSALWSFALYSRVVRYEETLLRERYGDGYARYVGEVPRWIPKGCRGWEGLVTAFLVPSVRAEAYNLLFLLAPLAKELWF